MWCRVLGGVNPAWAGFAAPPDPLEQHPVQQLGRRSGQEEWNPDHRSVCAGIHCFGLAIHS